MKKVKEKEKFRLRPDMLSKGEMIAASILVGILFPITRVSGTMCASYLAIPFIVFFFACGVFLVCFERTVYKMVIFRTKRDQYHNAESLFKTALLASFLSAVFLCIVLGFFAYDIMEGMFFLERGYIVLWLILPGVLLISVQGCIRGYLHGLGYTIQNFISMLILSITSFACTLILSVFANSYGEKVNALLHVDYISRFYTACVTSIAFSVGSLFSLLYITSFYGTKKKEISVYIKTGANKYLDSKAEVFDNLKYTLPVMFATLFVFLLDIRLFMSLSAKSDDITGGIVDLGLFIGKIIPILLVSVFILSLSTVKKWYQMEAAFKKDKKDIASILFGQIIHTFIRTFIPVAFFIIFMSDLILELIYGSSEKAEASLLGFFALFVFIFRVFVFFMWFVVRLEHMMLNIIGVLSFAVLHTLSSLLLISVMGKGLHGIALSFMLSMLVYDIVFFKIISSMLDFAFEDIYKPLIVLVGSIVACLFALILKNALRYVIGEILTMAVCVIVSYVVYVGVLAYMRGIERYSLSKLPLGNFFIKLTNMSSRRLSE